MSSAQPALAQTAGDSRVSTLELFFDLVFVFTITQLTTVLSRDPGLGGLGRVLLMLPVIWWMYGGYAWLTSAVEADRTTYRMLLLGGMGGFLVLSLAIPHAFSGGEVLFGVAYAVIVLIHAGMFTRSERGESAKSILLIAPQNLAMAGLIVLGGLIGGSAQYWLWLAAIALIAYNVIPGPRGSFDVAPGHFVERHTLVVIVALGESVVAVGIGAQHLSLSVGMVALALLGLALSACLWWTYFGDGGDERLTEAFVRADGVRRQRLGLDVFYTWHLLLLLGVVLLASTLRVAIAEPAAALSLARALALGAGTALFMAGVALSRRALGVGQTGWRIVAVAIPLALVPLGIWVSSLAQLIALVLTLIACLAADAAARPRLL